ncbi:hypothetical protein BDD12DRAFT_280608 [Trichophaea hybrida]|nr:hypothetical protein BDD12DRAFT_280608 [Trichophaea hybrida]
MFPKSHYRPKKLALTYPCRTLSLQLTYNAATSVPPTPFFSPCELICTPPRSPHPLPNCRRPHNSLRRANNHPNFGNFADRRALRLSRLGLMAGGCCV